MFEITKIILTFLFGLIIGFILTLIYFPYLQNKNENSPTRIDPSQLLLETENRMESDITSSKIAVLCLIIIFDLNNYYKMEQIKSTWGKRCNLLIFYEYENVDEPSKWNGFVSGLNHVYDNYFDYFEWILYTDLTTYAVLENIKFMLQDYDENIPYLFYSQSLGDDQIGIILSKEALRRFINEPINQITNNQDIFKYLKTYLSALGVNIKDTYDYKMKDTFLTINFVDKYIDNMINFDKQRRIKCLNIVDCFSKTPLAFMGVSEEEMIVLEFLIYNLKAFGV
ncbi:glycoprotein-N-acetylgalactosamine 3-beta-galactosyltransferase 1-like [Onthophagus taurus]|uniref:glycoprotein-N-acetylgalactosamine 3-beta-galactosyltransferase 1-like n=1 Tax=Onthophagus taurus TaxID=166361 RepID=UPI0039BE45C2